MKKYRTIKCKHCRSIFSSNKDNPLCPICRGQCSRKDKDATDFYKVEFKCPWCDKFVQFKKGMIRCPSCNKIILESHSGEYRVSAYGDLPSISLGTADEALIIAQYDLKNKNKFRKTDDKTVNNIKAIALALISVLLTVLVVAIIKSVS